MISKLKELKKEEDQENVDNSFQDFYLHFLCLYHNLEGKSFKHYIVPINGLELMAPLHLF